MGHHEATQQLLYSKYSTDLHPELKKEDTDVITITDVNDVNDISDVNNVSNVNDVNDMILESLKVDVSTQVEMSDLEAGQVVPEGKQQIDIDIAGIRQSLKELKKQESENSKRKIKLIEKIQLLKQEKTLREQLAREAEQLKQLEEMALSLSQ
jgi:hypothetical protein